MASYLKMYVDPKDIYDKLSDEDKEKYKEIVFTNCEIASDGTVNIMCLAVPDVINNNECRIRRQRFIKNDEYRFYETDGVVNDN